MVFIIVFKTGETDELFSTYEDAKNHIDLRDRKVRSITEVSRDIFHIARYGELLLYYIYTIGDGEIKGVFLSEDKAIRHAIANKWDMKEHYIKRLSTSITRNNGRQKLNL